MVNFCNISVCVYWLLVLTHDYDVYGPSLSPKYLSYLCIKLICFVFMNLISSLPVFLFSFCLAYNNIQSKFLLQHRNSSSSRRSAGSHSEKSSQKEEDSDNSDMDLSKPLKPIGSYIKNRSEMLDQMFHCIKGSTLKSAIPEELKVSAFFCVYGCYMRKTNFW